jgi:hypothetical protein
MRFFCLLRRGPTHGEPLWSVTSALCWSGWAAVCGVSERLQGPRDVRQPSWSNGSETYLGS